MTDPRDPMRLLDSVRAAGRHSLVAPPPARAVPVLAAQPLPAQRALVLGTPPPWLTTGLALAQEPGARFEASEAGAPADNAPWDVLLCADSVRWPGLEDSPSGAILLEDLGGVRIVLGESAEAAGAAFRAGHRRLLPMVAPELVSRALAAPSPGRWRHAAGLADGGGDRLTRAFLRHVALAPGLDPLHRAVAELGVSLRTLERHVSEQLGAEPRQIRMAYRADLRDWLLLGGFTLAAIAGICGYATDSVLCSAVRSETGQTAREWARTLLADVGI